MGICCTVQHEIIYSENNCLVSGDIYICIKLWYITLQFVFKNEILTLTYVTQQILLWHINSKLLHKKSTKHNRKSNQGK